ncbi:MAG: hypothetical protein GKC04_02565 [Methanomicrobiales archaeon]|nr:hypothetical protein [Methanomicrobiales archaeon]
MKEVEIIPVEIRWRLAARALSSLPLAYNWAYRDRVGAAYPHLEKAIFSEAAKDALAVSMAYYAPVDEATDIARIFGVVSSVIFGPGFEGSITTLPEMGARVCVFGCPLLEVARDLGFELERAYDACDAYTRAVMDFFNSSHCIIREKAMCHGDPRCEFAILKNP